MKRNVFFAVLLLVAFEVHAQLRDFDNRREGQLPAYNGKFDFLCLGIHRTFQKFDRNAKLYVRFPMPDGATNLFVNAAELLAAKDYVMEAKKTKLGPVATFGPWPTSDVIDKLGIQWNNLGVLAGFTLNGEKVFSPVDVGQTLGSARSLYTVHFRLGVSIRSLEVTATAKSGNKSLLLYQKSCDPKRFPGCTLWFDSSVQHATLDMSALPTGVYVIMLDGTLSDATDTHTKTTFLLYHRSPKQ